MPSALKELHALWSAPSAATPELQREANLLFKVMHAQVLGILGLALVIAIPGVLEGPPTGTLVLLVFVVPFGFAMRAAHRGSIVAASRFAIGAAVGSTVASTLMYGGLRSSIVITLMFGPVVAAILRGRRAALRVGGLVGAMCLGMAVLESRGVAPLLVPLDPHAGVVPSFVNAAACIAILVALLVVYTREMEQTTAEAQRAGERALDSLRHRLDAEQRQRQLEQELLDARRLESIGRLAGGLAHDLRNMLTPITLNTSLLAGDKAIHPAQRELLDEIQDAAERSTALLGQLLAFARKQRLQAEVVDLNRQLEHLEPLLRRLIREDIALEFRPGARLPHVRVDPSQLDQVMVNLVANARDAMPRGGTLSIETCAVEISGADVAALPGRAAGRYSVIVLRDTGEGMTDDVRQHAFDPFFTTKAKLGVGLGLATVHGIVAQSGGFIELASSVGLGTTFRVYLPSTDEVATGGSPVVPLRAGPAGEKVVLVVDDEALVRAALVRTLASAGHQVVEAGTADEALVLGRQLGRVDVLVTDVVMPGMHGPALAIAMRALHPDVGVLLVSGYTEGAPVADAPSGAALLAKPFAPEALLRKVDSLSKADVG